MSPQQRFAAILSLVLLAVLAGHALGADPHLRSASASPLAQQPDIPPGPCQAQIQALLSAIPIERQREIMGTAEDPNQFSAVRAAEQQALSDCLLQLVAPDLILAETDCQRAAIAVPRGQAWVHQVDLLGFADDFVDAYMFVHDATVAAHINCYNEAFDHCVNDHDPGQAVTMQAEHRAVLLLLKADDADPVDTSKLDKCLTFELDFDSSTEFGGYFSDHVQAKIALHLSPSANAAEGSGDLVYVSHTIMVADGSVCHTTTAPQGSSARVTNVKLNLDPTVTPVDPVASLVFDPGIPTSRDVLVCPDSPDLGVTSESWVTVFANLHLAERTADGYLIQGWSFGAGGVFARKFYQQTGEPGMSETTTFELRHTPRR